MLVLFVKSKIIWKAFGGVFGRNKNYLTFAQVKEAKGKGTGSFPSLIL
jgi:hypothetical protein